MQERIGLILIAGVLLGTMFIVDLSLEKPQNKFVARKQANNKALVFMAGATFTTIGTIQLIRARNSHFRFDRPKGAVPINPHNMLIGLGLFTISFSFVIS
jgi:hypothetical protein